MTIDHSYGLTNGQTAILHEGGKVRTVEFEATPPGQQLLLARLREEAGRRLLSSNAGEEVLNWLVEEIQQLLEVPFVFVGELHGADWDEVQTVALTTPGGLQENFRYSLAGTPCADVFEQDTCVFNGGVAALFPEDELLVEMGVDSYIGIPVHDTGGRPVGLIVVLEQKPLSSSAVSLGVSVLFAVKNLVMTLLERRRLSQDLALISSGMWARSTDLAPLMSVLRNFSRALFTRGAFLAQVSQENPMILEPRLVYWDGEAQPSGSLVITNNSLADIQGEGSQFVDLGFHSETHADLRALSGQCLMVPLVNSEGELVGIAGTLHPAVINPRVLNLPVVGAFAGRLSYELEESMRMERRQERNKRIRSQERVESLGMLAGRIAHDFNNMLAGIMGNADLLRSFSVVSNDSEATEILEDILSATGFGAALCERLMAYELGSPFEPKIFDLQEEVLSAVQIVQPTMGTGIDLKVALEGESYRMKGDPIQVRQVLLNLLSNASDAVSMHGEVRLSGHTRTVGLDSDLKVSHGEVGPGNFVVLTVTDNGVGMSADTASRIFDPFFSTKKSGHGLGLSGSLATVRNHSGAVHVESELGQGTKVSLILPLITEASQGESAGVPDRKPKERSLVLVVDDDPLVRGLHERFLRRMGLQVVSAVSAADALEIHERYQDDLALVVMDQGLPDMDGDDVLEQIRIVNPSIRCLISSGKPLSVPDTVSIIKPYSFRQFVSSVQQAMGLQTADELV